jgi:hypothetical protein
VQFSPGELAATDGATALSSVAASTTSVQLLAVNPNRRSFYIVNDSTSGNLYVAFAATASLTAYTVKLSPGLSLTPDPVTYRGAVSGIWDAAVGNARITEVTP